MRCLGVFLAFSLLSCFPLESVEALRAEGIIGGEETERNEIKYLVSLHYNGKHTCGGGIIGERFILTAAHCVIDMKTNEFLEGGFKIVAGINDLMIQDESRIEIGVEEIYVPEEYNCSYWGDDYPEADIAVLKLEDSLDLREINRLQMLHLPTADKPVYLYNYAEIAGFGWDNVDFITDENGLPDIAGPGKRRMHKACAFVIDFEGCQKYWNTRVYESNLCAGVVNHRDGRPQGICCGDSGGPLVYNGKVAIGIASGTPQDCNENVTPSIYTKVSSYLGFIRDARRGRVKDMRVRYNNNLLYT